MDFSLTQSQEMLRTAAREMVEREYSKETLLRLESGDRELGQRPVGQDGGSGLAGHPDSYEIWRRRQFADRRRGYSGGVGPRPCAGRVLLHGGPWRVIASAGGVGGAAESRSPWRSLGQDENISRGHRGPLRLEKGVDPHKGKAAGMRICVRRH